MAKDYTLTGVARSVQLGLGGRRFTFDPAAAAGNGRIQARDADDTILVNVQGADAIESQDFVTLAQLGSATGISLINSVGAGASLVASGSPPTAELRSITNGPVVSAVVNANQIDLDVVAGSIDTTRIANDAVTEPKLDAGVGVLYRTVTIDEATWNAPGPVNIGAVLPAGDVVVLGAQVLVLRGVGDGLQLSIGTAGTPNLILDGTTDINLNIEDTYVTQNAARGLGGQQLIGTKVGSPAEPATVVEVVVRFIRRS
jgi:hypothetical protein